MWNFDEHVHMPSTRFDGIYPAEVIDDTDTSGTGTGRVKVRVFPMMSRLDEDVLPWAIPAFGLFEGAASGQGSYTVPEEGSRVYVFFSAGDVRSPVYFANAPCATDGPSGREPGKMIWKTRSGHTITINDLAGSEEVRVEHTDGAVVTLKANGKLAIGTSSQELLDLFTQLLTALEQSTVNTQLGPQQLSKVIDGTVTTIKTSLGTIKGTI